jgi:hypothetical protein
LSKKNFRYVKISNILHNNNFSFVVWDIAVDNYKLPSARDVRQAGVCDKCVEDFISCVGLFSIMLVIHTLIIGSMLISF